jgi:hypothetical protein
VTTRPLALALTDSQLRRVLDTARLVPREWRRRFLDCLADLLMPLTDDCNRGDGITDAQVIDAADQALARFGTLPAAPGDEAA